MAMNSEKHMCLLAKGDTGFCIILPVDRAFPDIGRLCTVNGKGFLITHWCESIELAMRMAREDEAKKMSDTPRTDKAVPKGHINPGMTDYVPASFAKELERQVVQLAVTLRHQQIQLEASSFLSDEWDTCANLTESDEVVEKSVEYLYGATRARAIECAEHDKFDGYAAQARKILEIAAQAIRTRKPPRSARF